MKRLSVNYLAFGLSALLSVGGFGVAHAADVAKPAKVAVCAACHGENGHSKLGMYPNLGGQYKSYIERALHDYRAGTRKNAIMNAQAAHLTDAEIEALATWFSTRPPVVYTPSVTEPFHPQTASSSAGNS